MYGMKSDFCIRSIQKSLSCHLAGYQVGYRILRVITIYMSTISRRSCFSDVTTITCSAHGMSCTWLHVAPRAYLLTCHKDTVYRFYRTPIRFVLVVVMSKYRDYNYELPFGNIFLTNNELCNCYNAVQFRMQYLYPYHFIN